ncbi:MAG: M56 family metallopeptidase [Verrucomicrobiota bacterium]
MPTVPLDEVTSALNSWGARFAEIAGSMLVQSTVVAVVLLVTVWACSRTRAALRYGLLMLIPVKLLLPTSLSFPTGWAYWVQEPGPHKQAEPLYAHTVSGSVENRTERVTTTALSAEGVLFLLWISGMGILSALIVGRYRQVARLTGTPASPELERELDACRAQMGVRRTLRLKMSTTCASPAVSGLLKPVILIPNGLAEKLTPAQLRHVLLHELAHVKRGDLWVNHLQVAQQVLHWFNPLLWVANSVTRRVREEAVDDLVMARLGAEAPNYPATLVSVARMAFVQPPLRLGFVGIMESKAALKRRVTRLVQNPIGPMVGLGWARTGLIVATAAVLLPMARPSSGDKAMGQRQQTAKTGSRGEDGSRIELAAPTRLEFLRALQAQGMTYEQFREKFVGNRVLKPGELEEIARKWMAAQKGAPTNSAPSTVARIVIQHIGPAQASDEEIRARIGAKEGEPLSRTQVDADVRSLYATGLFSNVRVAQEPSAERTILTYVVQDRPRLEKIVFEGNTKIGDADLLEKLVCRVGDPLDERKLFNDTQTIQNIYQRLGFSDAGVKYRVSNDEKAGKSTVTFEIRTRDDANANQSPTFSPDARAFVMEKTVTVWDVASGRKLQTLPADTNRIPFRSVAFSPNGRLVSSGNTIIGWDAPNSNEVTTSEPQSNVIRSVTFSPDGKWLILTNSNGTPTLWELAPRRIAPRN